MQYSEMEYMQYNEENRSDIWTSKNGPKPWYFDYFILDFFLYFRLFRYSNF